MSLLLRLKKKIHGCGPQRDLEHEGGLFHSGLTSSGALVVKEDPVDSEHVVGLSEVHHDPVGIELGST